MSAETPPVQLDQDNPHAEAFGRLQELVREYLAGEISREYMAERHAAITAAARDDVTTAETCHGCDTNGGHYDWCQGADPELEDGVTELPGESRKGDTAATDLPRWRVTHDPNTDGSSFVGDLYRYNGARWEGQADDGTWVQSAYGGVDDMRRWGYGLSEVPPAQSGEAKA